MAQPNPTILATEDDAPMIPHAEQRRGLKIIAKSIYRELRAQGYDSKQIVGLATELITHITSDIKEQPGPRP